jgi:thioesterase domain-containing protein
MLLKSGHDQTRALLLLPGAGGNILYMQSLAMSIDADVPIYGLQPPGLDGVSPTHDTVEQLAAHYLAVIETSIPGRILTIAGHSFGGLIAFEMARQLENSAQEDLELGHKILILDSPAPQWFEPTGRDWSMHKWTRQVAEIASHQFARHVDMGDDLVDSDSDRSNPTQKLLDALIRAGIFPPQTPLRQLEGFLNVYRSNLQMEYAPATKLTRIEVNLIRSVDLQPEHLNDQRVNELRANPDLGWSEWVQSNLTTIQTPGDHLTMLNEPHVSTLADIIADTITRK